MMPELVECHAGYTYPERPTAVLWAGQQLVVSEIIERRRTPAGLFFRVRTRNHKTFDLTYDEFSDEWEVHEV
jgi:hypothetical protein